jgi:hypothetical protein
MSKREEKGRLFQEIDTQSKSFYKSGTEILSIKGKIKNILKEFLKVGFTLISIHFSIQLIWNIFPI